MNKSLLTISVVAVISITGCSGDIDSLTGYTASMLCSKVFVTGQDPDTVYDEDLVKITNGTAAFAKLSINTDNLAIQSKVLNKSSIAIYREGLGCTLVGSEGESALRDQDIPDIAPSPLSKADPWPLGSAAANTLSGFDYSSVENKAESHFTEHGDFQIKTSSLAVAYQGQLIYEKYAQGITQNTPIYGFSLGKTIATLLTGVLVHEGQMDIYSPVGLMEWQYDTRRDITPHHLLTMTSGLEWSETYDSPTSDANMLFVKDDMGAFAANKPLVASPGNTYNYSTGSTMILSRMIKSILGGEIAGSYQSLHEQLLRKLDINNTVVQADASGSLVFGMQDLVATHDLTRLGQFILQNGEWRGEQILPADWVTYMSTPVDLSTNFGFDYGAGLWLNTAQNGQPFLPSLPSDTLIGYGLRGQFLIVVPSLELVIVRTGNTLDMETLGLIPEIDQLAATIIEALPNN